MIQIFNGITGRKKYLVFDANANDDTALALARKFFKVSAAHLNIQKGWVLDDYLYLENPKVAKAKVVKAVYWRK